MDLKTWRESRLHELTLPSGLAVKVRDVSLVDVVINGDIPDGLLSIVATATEGKTEFDLRQLQENREALPYLGQLINQVVKSCLVSPPVDDQPGANTLGINELSYADKLFVFEWANREVGSLEPFREKA